MAILASQTKTGISWIGESIALFKQAPRKWLLLALAYLGIFVLIPSFPGMQAFALMTILIWPVFIAIAIRMYRNTEFQKQENFSTTMQLIQPTLRRLIALGLVNLGYFIVVSMLLSADMQTLVEIMNKQQQMSEQEMVLAMQNITPIFLKLILLFIPLMMATWFAPMLIAFNHYPVIKSLKSSIAGSLQYLVALTAAWLLLSAGIMLLMLGTSIFSGLFAIIDIAFAQSLMTILIFGALLISVALTLAFQYVSYRDIFRAAPNL
jgi:hypothetical protein